MTLTPDLLDELELLNTMLQGLKIHRDAAPARIAAGKRLHAKGMITLPDGGYLTPLGQQTSEHAHALVAMLSSPRSN